MSHNRTVTLPWAIAATALLYTLVHTQPSVMLAHKLVYKQTHWGAECECKSVCVCARARERQRRCVCVCVCMHVCVCVCVLCSIRPIADINAFGPRNYCAEITLTAREIHSKPAKAKQHKKKKHFSEDFELSEQLRCVCTHAHTHAHTHTHTHKRARTQVLTDR